MCDEINVVIAPCADNPLKLRLYLVKKRLSNYNPVEFNLIEVKVMDSGTLWSDIK